MKPQNIAQNFEALDTADQYDVCIVGSGPAGSVLCRSLVAQGVKTLVLESGKNLMSWWLDKRIKTMAAYELTGNTNYPLTNTRARTLGGTSNFWTGRCTRFNISDFEQNPYTPEGNPWPINYSELEPYYEKAEKTLRVRGCGLSESAPPRKNPFPLQSKTDLSDLKSLLAAVGIASDCSPTATPKKGFRFFRAQKEILPGTFDSPLATILEGANVTRIIAGKDNKIEGLEVRTMTGDTKTARAKLFVIAGGGIETPRLLLHSRCDQFPKGIGNVSGMVGKGFNDHPAVNFFGTIRHTKGTLSPIPKIVRSHQYYDAFRQEGLGSVLLVFRQAWVFPHHNLPLLGLSKWSNLPKSIFTFLRRTIQPTLYIGATIEQNLLSSNRVTLSEQRKDCFGNPLAHLHFDFSQEDLQTLNRTRELIIGIYNKLGATDVRETEVSWSRHHQSTCRMGNNPQRSVTDRYLRVHESPNLYLCGSEVFVTGGAMQPCLTIVALAHRLADYLKIRLSQG